MAAANALRQSRLEEVIADLSRNIRSSIDTAVHYYYVGLIPNLIATQAECVAAVAWATGHRTLATVKLIGGLLNLGAGYLKFREYQGIKEALSINGWDERIVQPKMYSHYKRHAARQAAKELGYLAEFDQYAEREGYKWYHFLPKIHRLGETAQQSLSEISDGGMRT